MIQVTNVGTDPRTYRAKPMIDEWRDKRDIAGGVRCCVYGCHAWATDGAHVTVGHGSKIYIVPMCHKHNCQFGKTMWVRKTAMPVRLTSIE